MAWTEALNSSSLIPSPSAWARWTTAASVTSSSTTRWGRPSCSASSGVSRPWLLREYISMIALEAILVLPARDRLAVDPGHRVAGLATLVEAARAEHEQRGHERRDDDEQADLQPLAIPAHERDHDSSLSGIGGRATRGPFLGHHAAGHRDESGVGHHAVERPHGGAVDVPRPHQRLERLHQRPGSLVVERLRGLVRLDDRRHVAHEDAARPEHAGDGLGELPRLRQIEDDPVHRLLVGQPLLDRDQPDGQVGDLARPHVDVGHRAAGELLALLEGDHAALRARPPAAAPA